MQDIVNKLKVTSTPTTKPGQKRNFFEKCTKKSFLVKWHFSTYTLEWDRRYLEQHKFNAISGFKLIDIQISLVYVEKTTIAKWKGFCTIRNFFAWKWVLFKLK